MSTDDTTTTTTTTTSGGGGGITTSRDDGRRVDEIVAGLRSLTPDEDPALAGLTERFAEGADAAGLLDVAYRTVDSPFGMLLVAVTPRGVVRIAFEREDHDRVLLSLASTVSPRILRSGRRTDDVARQLDEYLAGTRRSFDLPVDLRLVSGFRHAVVSTLPQIPYGSTASYATVAELAGRPTAVRAVGSACSHNPVPLVVPCHRVIRSDGSIGQYLGGPEAKAALLALEAE